MKELQKQILFLNYYHAFTPMKIVQKLLENHYKIKKQNFFFKATLIHIRKKLIFKNDHISFFFNEFVNVSNKILVLSIFLLEILDFLIMIIN